MRFIPALSLSLAQCLPTTALTKGAHGASNIVSRSHVPQSICWRPIHPNEESKGI